MSVAVHIVKEMFCNKYTQTASGKRVKKLLDKKERLQSFYGKESGWIRFGDHLNFIWSFE